MVVFLLSSAESCEGLFRPRPDVTSTPSWSSVPVRVGLMSGGTLLTLLQRTLGRAGSWPSPFQMAREIAYLLQKRRSAFLDLRMTGV